MRYFTLVSATCLLAVATSLVFELHATGADGKTDRVLKHVVLYKFKADVMPEQVQQVVNAFAALPRKIDTVIGFERGTNVSTEGKSDGLTHGFVVSFRDEQGLQAYLRHPAHLEYVNLVRGRREKVVVFDYWAP